MKYHYKQGVVADGQILRTVIAWLTILAIVQALTNFWLVNKVVEITVIGASQVAPITKEEV